MSQDAGTRASLDAIHRAATSLLPELKRRLTEHGLGEVEVRHGDVRIRVRAAAAPPSTASPTPSQASGASGAEPPGDGGQAPAEQRRSSPVVSPAVGIFVYGQGLGPGLSVSAGDSLGHVEMLGVQYEVRAPDTGSVSHLVAETGEAVEYGQVLIELEPEPGPEPQPEPAR